jgi:hypothetical protein
LIWTGSTDSIDEDPAEIPIREGDECSPKVKC